MLVVAMRHAHAAADKDVVADDLRRSRLSEEAEILGEKVDGIVFGQGEADLELARQIEFAVDRLLFDAGGLGSTGLPLSQIS